MKDVRFEKHFKTILCFPDFKKWKLVQSGARAGAEDDKGHVIPRCSQNDSSSIFPDGHGPSETVSDFLDPFFCALQNQFPVHTFCPLDGRRSTASVWTGDTDRISPEVDSEKLWNIDVSRHDLDATLTPAVHSKTLHRCTQERVGSIKVT